MKVISFIKTVVVVLGGLLIVGGVGLKWVLFPSVLRSVVLKQLQLSPDNDETWRTWVEPTKDLPVYMKFYFHSVINPTEILLGDQPEVKEIGPFVYKEVRRKEGISIMEDTITFGNYISYEFDKGESCDVCDQDSQITVINPALVGIVALVQKQSAQYGGDLVEKALFGMLDEIIKLAEYEDGLFTTQTANELIFEGYESGVIKATLTVLEELGVEVPIPDIISDGKFAFFKGKNATADFSWYEINSGLYDMKQYQRILSYNGKESLPESWWGNISSTPSANKSGVHGKCKELAGTDGTQYPPFVDQAEDLWLFSSDLCRSIYLSFYQEVDMDGITTNQFRVKPEVLSFSNPENACFCPDVEECIVEEDDTWNMDACTHCRDGMLDLMGCQDAPVIVSLPHFLDASREDQTAVKGIHPNPDLHTTYLNVEPNTGVALDAHKRIQVNVPLKPNENFPLISKVKEVIFPVVWVDETATLEGENLEKLKEQLVTPFLAVDIGVGFMIGVGALIIIAVSAHSLICSNR